MPALAYDDAHPARLLFLMRLIDQVPTKAQMIEAGAGENGEALIAIARDEMLRVTRACARRDLSVCSTHRVRARRSPR